NASDSALHLFNDFLRGSRMNLGLQGKVAMVGGASKGLGLAVARALAGEGAQVSIASRNPDAIQAARARIQQESGAQILAVAADLASDAAIAEWHRTTVDRLGPVDLLFTNSGGPPAGRVLDFDDSGWRTAFELLVLSVIRQVRLVVPSMQKRGG